MIWEKALFERYIMKEAVIIKPARQHHVHILHNQIAFARLFIMPILFCAFFKQTVEFTGFFATVNCNLSHPPLYCHMYENNVKFPTKG